MTRKRFWTLSLLTVVTAFLVAACGGAAGSTRAPTALPTTGAPAPTESPTATKSPAATVPSTATGSPLVSQVGAAPNNAPAKAVAPDPNFEDELKSARLSTRGWNTDFSLHTVPFDEIFSGASPETESLP